MINRAKVNVVIFILVLGLVNKLPAQTVDEVIANFRESVAKRRSFSAQVHARHQEPGMQAVDVQKGTWLVAGDSQRRTETIWLRPSADSVTAFRQDVQLTAREWRRLENHDPEHTPELPLRPSFDASDYNRLVGYAEPPADSPKSSYHKSAISDYLSMTVNRWMPILDYLDEHRQQCVAGEHEGLPSIVVPAVNHPWGDRYRLSFDPAVDWSIRKNELLDSEGVVRTFTVKEFLNDQGCYLPTQVEGTSRDGVRTEITAEYSRVNEPVPDSEFIVNFPEGCRVYAPRGKVHIWGKDAPAQTFTEEELDAWEEGLARAELAEARSARRPGVSYFWIYSNIALITLILGLSFWRSRLERKT